MKRIATILMGMAVYAATMQAKTLVVYYSFTNNCRTIATELKGQLTDADILEVQPAEEGIDYAANNYAIGSAMIAAIRNNPTDATSYPAIKQTDTDLNQYSEVVIIAPLWWSNMAAPMQTFLFQNGKKLTGKKLGLIVSSASSGISSVVADAKRLVPDGDFYADNLWIRSSQTGNCNKLLAEWIKKTGVGSITSTAITDINADYRPTISLNNNSLQVNEPFNSIHLFDTKGTLLVTSSENNVDTSSLQTAVGIVMVRNGKHTACYKIMP